MSRLGKPKQPEHQRRTLPRGDEDCYICLLGERFQKAIFLVGPTAKPDPAEMRRVQPDGSVLFCGTSLCIRVAILKPGVVLVSARGEVADAQDSRAEAGVLAELDLEFDRAGRLTLFADLRASARIPAVSRENLAKWLRRHQARLLPSHVLVRSKLVEMALSIITMLVGSGVFKIHSDVQTFLGLVKKVAPKLTELPRVPE